MTNLLNDLELAKIIIERKKNCSKFDCIYSFTNENLIGSLNSFKLKNKSCLTVLSSSDQVLDMYLKGAKKIDTFDINPLTYYYFHLKKAALLSNITKNEFISFFYSDDENWQNMSYYKLFSKIIPNLSNDEMFFWEELYSQYTPVKIRNNLFLPDIPCEDDLPKMINYLKGKNYDVLKEKVHDLNINFLNLDIVELPKNLTESYDFIYLSNIMQYAKYIYKIFSTNFYSQNIESYKKYKELVLQLNNNLNKNGKIVVCYFFNSLFLGLIPLKEISTNIFFENNFKLSKFKSRENIGDKNAILTYKKKKF